MPLRIHPSLLFVLQQQKTLPQHQVKGLDEWEAIRDTQIKPTVNAAVTVRATPDAMDLVCNNVHDTVKHPYAKYHLCPRIALLTDVRFRRHHVGIYSIVSGYVEYHPLNNTCGWHAFGPQTVSQGRCFTVVNMVKLVGVVLLFFVPSSARDCTLKECISRSPVTISMVGREPDVPTL